MRLHPWSEPVTMREGGGGLVPSFKIGARGMAGLVADRSARVEVHDFREHNRGALEAFRAGEREVAFPYGSYKTYPLHGAV